MEVGHTHIPWAPNGFSSYRLSDAIDKRTGFALTEEMTSAYDSHSDPAKLLYGCHVAGANTPK